MKPSDNKKSHVSKTLSRLRKYFSSSSKSQLTDRTLNNRTSRHQSTACDESSDFVSGFCSFRHKKRKRLRASENCSSDRKEARMKDQRCNSFTANHQKRTGHDVVGRRRTSSSHEKTFSVRVRQSSKSHVSSSRIPDIGRSRKDVVSFTRDHLAYCSVDRVRSKENVYQWLNNNTFAAAHDHGSENAVVGLPLRRCTPVACLTRITDQPELLRSLKRTRAVSRHPLKARYVDPPKERKRSYSDSICGTQVTPQHTANRGTKSHDNNTGVIPSVDHQLDVIECQHPMLQVGGRGKRSSQFGFVRQELSRRSLDGTSQLAPSTVWTNVGSTKEEPNRRSLDGASQSTRSTQWTNIGSTKEEPIRRVLDGTSQLTQSTDWTNIGSTKEEPHRRSLDGTSQLTRSSRWTKRSSVAEQNRLTASLIQFVKEVVDNLETALSQDSDYSGDIEQTKYHSVNNVCNINGLSSPKLVVQSGPITDQDTEHRSIIDQHRDHDHGTQPIAMYPMQSAEPIAKQLIANQHRGHDSQTEPIGKCYNDLEKQPIIDWLRGHDSQTEPITKCSVPSVEPVTYKDLEKQPIINWHRGHDSQTESASKPCTGNTTQPMLEPIRDKMSLIVTGCVKELDSRPIHSSEPLARDRASVDEKVAMVTEQLNVLSLVPTTTTDDCNCDVIVMPATTTKRDEEDTATECCHDDDVNKLSTIKTVRKRLSFNASLNKVSHISDTTTVDSQTNTVIECVSPSVHHCDKELTESTTDIWNVLETTIRTQTEQIKQLCEELLLERNKRIQIEEKLKLIGESKN